VCRIRKGGGGSQEMQLLQDGEILQCGVSKTPLPGAPSGVSRTSSSAVWWKAVCGSSAKKGLSNLFTTPTTLSQWIYLPSMLWKIHLLWYQVATSNAAVHAGTNLSTYLSDYECHFCRATASDIPPEATGDQNDLFVRVKKRISVGDVESFSYFGWIYSEGIYVVPQNATKVFELRSTSADLGSTKGR